MKRRRREHGFEVLAGKLRVLKTGVHKLRPSGAFQVLLGERHQVLSGLERRHVKPASDKTAGQLTAAAPCLEDVVAALDFRDPTGTVDELVGIRRAAAVVLRRHLIEDLAVVPCAGAAHPRDSTESVAASVSREAVHGLPQKRGSDLRSDRLGSVDKRARPGRRPEPLGGHLQGERCDSGNDGGRTWIRTRGLVLIRDAL